MPLYFAYGSNMLRARIERRVGRVGDLGWSTVSDHRHHFDKRGHDGSGKGNIVPAVTDVVHGVLYELTDAQLEVLDDYEYGYRRELVGITCRADDRVCEAITYYALERVSGLVATDEYLSFYERGMREHGLPLGYRRRILQQGRGAARVSDSFVQPSH